MTMESASIWYRVCALLLLCNNLTAFEIRKLNGIEDPKSVMHVRLSDAAGQNYNLKLTKPDTSVLHPAIKYININNHEQTDNRLYDTWTPSPEELEAANDVHLDHENQAVVKMSNDEDGNRILHGLFNGIRFLEKNGTTSFFENDQSTYHDYVDTHANLTYNNVPVDLNGNAPDYVVETVIVCDKEFGDKFQHNRQQILNYWTVFFWDVNMRYKTLPSSNISFRITSIIVIQNTNQQPFVEDSRDANGKAALNQVLGKFAFWIWSQWDNLPKFDMAVAALATPISFADGIAYVSAACNRNTGTVVWGDDGSWRSVLTGAHEIAHNLGAPHDTDANFPGGCSSRGYIMGGGAGPTQYQFSECSDRTIAAYVRSDRAACLQRLDESSSPVISPEFDSSLATSVADQCKRFLGPDAEVGVDAAKNCTRVLCWRGNTAWSFVPVDNSPCVGWSGDDGRCFRGRCFTNQEQSFLKNVGTGQCLLQSDRFSGNDAAQMSNCPGRGTPLSQFRTFRVQRGYWLITRYTTYEPTMDKDKCIVASEQEGGTATFGECSTTAGNRSEWRLEEVADGEYLLMEATTKRCAKQEGNLAKLYANCDRNDRAMRWKISVNDF